MKRLPLGRSLLSRPVEDKGTGQLSHLTICSAKAAPSALQLGMLLGYPGSEITVEQITDEERILWATPTARERRNGLALPDSRSLIAAYRVTGRNASTFYPMLIWVGAEGAFLNSSTKQTIDLIASDEAKPVSKGGRGPFGPLLFEGLGEGGVYLGKVKVKSEVKEMTEPQEKAAMISVLRLPSLHLDLKIEFMASLKGSPDLSAISGGERYFESFRSSREGEPEIRYNLAELIEGLNRLVSSEPYAAAPTQTLPASQIQVTDDKSSAAKSSAANLPQREVEQAYKKPSSAWAWLASAILILGVVVFLKKRR